MCQICGQPVYIPCSCNTSPCVQTPQPCCPDTTGCPVQLDFTCVIYHKSNNELTELDGLGLTNGVTLEAFAHAVDEFVKQLNVPDWELSYLRGVPNSYTIDNLEQFGEAVDDELQDLQTQITALVSAGNTPITEIASNSIDLVLSGTLNHSIQANAKISAIAPNLLTIQADGLHAAAQTLNVNVGAKTLSISDGNTVSLAGLLSGVSGFIGNVTADPGSPLDGQYWFRTDLPVANGLRIQLNGSVRTIPTT